MNPTLATVGVIRTRHHFEVFLLVNESPGMPADTVSTPVDGGVVWIIQIWNRGQLLAVFRIVLKSHTAVLKYPKSAKVNAIFLGLFVRSLEV